VTVDELTDYGLERMDDDAIRDCLAAESVGVLGLPTDDVPYLLPLSYGYDPDPAPGTGAGAGAAADADASADADADTDAGDGDDGRPSVGTLYFAYLTGGESRKATLTERAGRARFLVYDVETQFRWRSVLATGPLARVPEADLAAARATLGDAWRPNLLDTATTAGGVDVYGLAIEAVDGIRQSGLAPGFRENVSP
jgi:nitroimidazol reductase NimA-like FMN-containing flavoprotein (pyridoxamine 5'-phosphate oxidase superfamily)